MNVIDNITWKISSHDCWYYLDHHLSRYYYYE